MNITAMRAIINNEDEIRALAITTQQLQMLSGCMCVVLINEGVAEFVVADLAVLLGKLSPGYTEALSYASFVPRPLEHENVLVVESYSHC